MNDIVTCEDGSYFMLCPHCGGALNVLPNEVNCQIFRHGIVKTTRQQVNPHTPKQECDRLAETDYIFGCGKPFRIFARDGKWAYVDKCDYI